MNFCRMHKLISPIYFDFIYFTLIFFLSFRISIRLCISFLIEQGFPVPPSSNVCNFAMLLVLIAWFLCILEPVGSKAPTFTGDVKGVWMEKMTASSVVLPCPAQGYPVPSFR